MRWIRKGYHAASIVVESWSFIGKEWWDEAAALKKTNTGWWYKPVDGCYQKIEGVSSLAEAKAYVETLYRMGEL